MSESDERGVNSIVVLEPPGGANVPDDYSGLRTHDDVGGIRTCIPGTVRTSLLSVLVSAD